MTSTAALVISVAFLINEISLLPTAEVGVLLSGDYLASNIVYLISNCLLFKKLCFFRCPKTPHRVILFLEIPVALLCLEYSMVYLWNALQRFIRTNANEILVHLDGVYGRKVLECDKEECPEVFTQLYECPKTAPHNQQASVIPRPARRLDAPLSPSYSRDMHRNRIERTASKRWRGSVRRVVSAAVFNLSCFTHGCSTGWVSGVLGREALTGGAWLAALPCLVALPAAPFFAFLADAKGRKAGALCICLSFILSWSLAAWCGPRGVWAARVAAGAGGAGALALAPLYCAEISPKTKGLAAMPTLAMSCGILFAFVAGGVLSAHTLSLYMAAPPTILLFSLVWLPETPSFLISVGRMQDAAKVICWLDGSDFREDLTDAIEQQEVMIRTEPDRRGSDALQPMLKRSRSEATSEGKENSVCRDLFRHRRSRRALLSCCLLLTAAAGSGAGAVNSFATAVLTHSGHVLPALNITAYNFTVYNGTVSRGWRETSETGSVLCGTALVLGAAVATVTVDRFGRKVLLLISCVGIAFSLAILGLYCDPRTQMYSWYSHQLWPYRKTSAIKEKTHNFTVDIPKDYLRNLSDTKPYKMENASAPMVSIEMLKTVKANTKEEPTEAEQNSNNNIEENAIWASVILLSIVLFLYNIGLGSVPYVLISELFSINVRSLASSLLISWMWLCSFTTLRYFSSLAITLGLHGTYYVGASITLLASGYIYFMLPETRGKNQKQIDDLLNGPLLVHLKRKRKTNET